MDGKTTCRRAALAFALALLLPAAASAGPLWEFWHGPPDGYSPNHYRFPLLWRLNANCHGVPGMPVSVYPPPAELRGLPTDQEVAAPATPAAPAAASEPIPAPEVVPPLARVEGE